MNALEDTSYFDARKKVRELHATPKPGASYALVSCRKPQICSLGTQTCSVSMQTDPTPVAPSIASTTKNTTTDTHSTSKATTNVKSSKYPYSVAVTSPSHFCRP